MKHLPNIKIRVGQRWRNKKNGGLVEITGTQGDRYKTKNAYGSSKSHTITKHDLLVYWELT